MRNSEEKKEFMVIDDSDGTCFPASKGTPEEEKRADKIADEVLESFTKK